MRFVTRSFAKSMSGCCAADTGNRRCKDYGRISYRCQRLPNLELVTKLEISNPDDPEKNNQTKLRNYCTVIDP
ncbi:hypothetical protein TNCV_2320161 [Trichonephila clavipes]|nr:hypothetical protein TNCV_2320161 [Trichonephila clavipes]